MLLDMKTVLVPEDLLKRMSNANLFLHSVLV
jgi:hypothetical protein